MEKRSFNEIFFRCVDYFIYFFFFSHLFLALFFIRVFFYIFHCFWQPVFRIICNKRTFKAKRKKENKKTNIKVFALLKSTVHAILCIRTQCSDLWLIVFSASKFFFIKFRIPQFLCVFIIKGWKKQSQSGTENETFKRTGNCPFVVSKCKWNV